MEVSTFLDLACENFEEENSTDKNKIWKSSSGNLQIRWGEDKIHKHYAVFFTEPIWRMCDESFFEVREKLSQELYSFLFCDGINRAKGQTHLLVAGLGNPKMTADALGAEVVDRIAVTRKMEDVKNADPSVSAVSLGVLGTTGIESFEHLDALCGYLKPNVVLVVDALSAKSQARIGATIQISTGGISPGAGVGNSQKSLCRETLGVPVVSLGVPMVVRSSVIVREAMNALGVEFSKDENGFLTQDSFFMMPKEGDLILRNAAVLLASAINRACDFSFQSSHRSEAP